MLKALFGFNGERQRTASAECIYMPLINCKCSKTTNFMRRTYEIICLLFFFCYCCKCDFASADLDCCAATLYIFYCYCNLYLQLSNAGLSECWHIDTFMSTCVCVPFVDYVYAICWLIVFAFACCCWFGEMLLLLLWTHVRMCSCMCSCELWWQIVVVPAIVVVVGRLLRTKAVAAILNLLTNNTY